MDVEIIKLTAIASFLYIMFPLMQIKYRVHLIYKKRNLKVPFIVFSGIPDNPQRYPLMFEATVVRSF